MSNHSSWENNGKTKKRITTAALALMSFTAYMPISTMAAFAIDVNNATPSVNDVQSANGAVWTEGDTTHVDVRGGAGTVGQFDWKDFNVGKNKNVDFGFTANGQTSLNRVLGGNMSYIYGKLYSSSRTMDGKVSACDNCANTSKVILINPAGMLFGNGSSVNLNSFVASTYDVKGAQNLKDFSTQAARDAYVNNLWNIAGSPIEANGEHGVQFVANDNMVDGTGFLTGDGTGQRLASIVVEGQSDIYADKSLALVGNRIEVKGGSTLRTHFNNTPNFNSSTNSQNLGNVKLVTGDGVTFTYSTAGNIVGNSATTKTHKQTGQKYGISITDSMVKSGDILIYNGGNATTESGANLNTAIDIENSGIWSKKLTNRTDGNIAIQSKTGDINIKKSNIVTQNAQQGDDAYATKDEIRGNITIKASKGNINITDSQVRTADSTKNNTTTAKNSGNITIEATKGSVNLKQESNAMNGQYWAKTGVVAAGILTVKAGQDVNINGYNEILALGDKNINSDNEINREIDITAGNNINLTNTFLNSKDIGLEAKNSLTSTGSTIQATNNLSAISQNTKFDNSLLWYDNLKLYDDSFGRSNVTIANNTKIHDKGASALNLTTNGNLTITNTKLLNYSDSETAQNTSKYNSYNLTSTNGNVTVNGGSNIVAANGNANISAQNGAVTVDNSTFRSSNGGVNINAKNDINIQNAGKIGSTGSAINVASSAGNVTISGGSFLEASGTPGASTSDGGYITQTGVNGGNITVTSGNGKNVTVTGTDSKINANNGKVTINSGNKLIVTNGGEIYAKGRTDSVQSGIEVNQKGDMNVDTDLANGTLATSGHITINTDGNFISSELVGGKGNIKNASGQSIYSDLVSLSNGNSNSAFIFRGGKDSPKGRMEVNAKGNITSNGFVSSNGVDFNAGNDISFTNTNAGGSGKENITLTDTNLKAGNDIGVKTTNGNMTVNNSSTDAGNNANLESTNGDLLLNGFEMKRGKKTKLTGGNSVKTKEGTDIDTNGNKLAVDSRGEIDIAVSEMDAQKPENGLEINAELNTNVKDNAGVLRGRNVKVKATDGTLVVSKIKAENLTLEAQTVKSGSTTISRQTDHVNNYDGESGNLSDSQISDKAYIEVTGEFNLDRSKSYDGNTQGRVEYHDNTAGVEEILDPVKTGSHSTTATDTDTETRQKASESTLVENSKRDTVGEPTGNTSTRYENTGKTQDKPGSTPRREYVYDDEGNPTGYWEYTETEREQNVYERVEHKVVEEGTYYEEERTITTTTTTTYDDYTGQKKTTEDQHTAKIDGDDFVLIYDKDKTEANGTTSVKSGTSTSTTEGAWTKTNRTFTATNETNRTTTVERKTGTRWVPNGERREWCTMPGQSAGDSGSDDGLMTVLDQDIAAMIKNPLKSEGTSNSANVTKNIANPADLMISAAAKITTDEDAENDDEFDEEIEF